MSEHKTRKIVGWCGFILVGCGSGSGGDVANSATGGNSQSSGAGGSSVGTAGTNVTSGSGGNVSTVGGATSATAGNTSMAGAAGAGPTGNLALIGSRCNAPGALACAGQYQKLTLLCGGDGTWQANQTCGVGEFCDSTLGVNSGICRPEISACLGTPGRRYCENVDRLMACSPDATSTELVEICKGRCFDGACDPILDPCPKGANTGSLAKDCGGSWTANSECFVVAEQTPPLTVRLPHSSWKDLEQGIASVSGVCSGTCKVLHLGFAASWPIPVRVAVGAPWLISAYPASFPGGDTFEWYPMATLPICSKQDGKSCRFVDANMSVFVYSTQNPSPPRNLTVVPATANMTCDTVLTGCDLLPAWTEQPRTFIEVNYGDRIQYNGQIFEYNISDFAVADSPACALAASPAADCPWKLIGPC